MKKGFQKNPVDMKLAQAPIMLLQKKVEVKLRKAKREVKRAAAREAKREEVREVIRETTREVKRKAEREVKRKEVWKYENYKGIQETDRRGQKNPDSDSK